mmetsp:Transcript_27544/g.44802  ORF Transcript_27544/g.44802 Transcript_27544/m.44802 type:complete len:201 (-) Transcript_27544:88-690(-)
MAQTLGPLAMSAIFITASGVSVAIGSNTLLLLLLVSIPLRVSSSNFNSSCVSTFGTINPSAPSNPAAISSLQSSTDEESGLILTRTSVVLLPGNEFATSRNARSFSRPTCLSFTESSRSRTMVSAPSVSALERNLSLSAGTKWTDRRRRSDIEDRCRWSGGRKRFVVACCFKRSVVSIVSLSSAASFFAFCKLPRSSFID